MFDLICLGHAALDRVYAIDAFPAAPTKLRAHSAIEVGGGMAATAAVAAARLGGRVAFWGRIGDDPAGQAIRRELEAEGVDTVGLRTCAGAVTSTSAVVVDAAGERLIVTHLGEGLEDNPGFLPLHMLAHARAVLVDPRWPEGALALLAAARARAVASVVDVEMLAGPVLPALLALAGHAVFSRPGLAEFAPGLSEPEGLALARAAGAATPGVTQGAHGYLWLDEAGRAHRQPAFPVAAIDTTGAGDAFHGAYALGVAHGLAAAECARQGAAAAALKCTRPGTRAGLPSRDALEAFLATHPT
jgi:sulfofructose kinase